MQPILISIRGDQELNEVKLLNEITHKLNKDILKLEVITNEQIIKQGLQEIPFGYLGPDLQDSYLENAVSW